MAEQIEDLTTILAASVEQSKSSVADFIPEAEPVVIDVSEDFEEPEVEVDPEPETETDIPLTKEALKKAGKRWIGFVDRLQRPFLTSAYEKAILKPGDSAKMASYQKQADLHGSKKIKDAIADDDELYYVLKRFEKYKDACEGIPFTEEEKEMIAEPLGEVLEMYKNMHMSPQMALLAAVAMVMLPRVEPMFPNLFKGLNL